MPKSVTIAQTRFRHQYSVEVDKWQYIPFLAGVTAIDAPKIPTLPAIGYYLGFPFFWDVANQVWVKIGSGIPFVATNGDLTKAQRIGDALIGIQDRYTKEYVAMNKTTVNASGAAITDADVDGIIYFKAGTEYFVRVIQSAYNLGWWNIVPNTTAVDNYASIQAALNAINRAGGGRLSVPKGNFWTRSSDFLTVYSNTVIVGQGYGSTILYRTAANTQATFQVQGSNVSVLGIQFQQANATNGLGDVEVKYGINILVEDCYFNGSFFGVMFNPGNNQTIRNVAVMKCKFNQFNAGIDIGAYTLVTGESVSNVVIHGCDFENGRYVPDGGDCIKTRKNCYGIIITSNHLTGATRDGIDLFASGDRVLISANYIKSNTIKGLDIKFDSTNYPLATYGNNGRFLDITGNIFDSNDSGITIIREAATGLFTYAITITGNQFYNTPRFAINANCKSIKITDNHFQNNAWISTTTVAHVIQVGDNTVNSAMESCIINNNTFINNGAGIMSSDGTYVETKGIVYMIYVAANCKGVSVRGNMITNDTALPNPYTFYGIYVNALTSNIELGGNQFQSNYTDSTGTIVLNGFISNYQIINGAGVLFDEKRYFVSTSLAAAQITTTYLNTNYPYAFYPINSCIVFTGITESGSTPSTYVKATRTGQTQWMIEYVQPSVTTTPIINEVGAFSPLNLVNGGIGSTFKQTNVGAGSILWVNQTGLATGWVPYQ